MAAAAAAQAAAANDADQAVPAQPAAAEADGQQQSSNAAPLCALTLLVVTATSFSLSLSFFLFLSFFHLSCLSSPRIPVHNMCQLQSAVSRLVCLSGLNSHRCAAADSLDRASARYQPPGSLDAVLLQAGLWGAAAARRQSRTVLAVRSTLRRVISTVCNFVVCSNLMYATVPHCRSDGSQPHWVNIHFSKRTPIHVCVSLFPLDMEDNVA